MSLSLYVDSSLMMVDDHPQSHWMSCMLLSNQRQDGSKTTRVQLSQSSRWEQTVSWTCPLFLLKSGFWTLTLCKECSFCHKRTLLSFQWSKSKKTDYHILGHKIHRICCSIEMLSEWIHNFCLQLVVSFIADINPKKSTYPFIISCTLSTVSISRPDSSWKRSHRSSGVSALLEVRSQRQEFSDRQIIVFDSFNWRGLLGFYNCFI